MVFVYGAKPEAKLKVSCYVDVSFQTDKDDTKSQTGYVFVLNGGAVDWKSAKQSTTRMSSIEAEYIVAAEASMEVVWIRKSIDGLGGVVPSNGRPMEMLCDNEHAIAITNDLGILKGAKHFQRKYHYIREVIQERKIVLKKVHIDDNVVDPFTKPMSYDKHFEHDMAIGIIPARSLISDIFRGLQGYLDNDFQQTASQILLTPSKLEGDDVTIFGDVVAVDDLKEAHRGFGVLTL
ncbi:hypothetical protein Tco_0235899, partial [Tanacetum coccineum]